MAYPYLFTYILSYTYFFLFYLLTSTGPVPGTGTIGSDNYSIVSTFLLAKMLTNLLKPPEEIFLLTPLPTYRLPSYLPYLHMTGSCPG